MNKKIYTIFLLLLIGSVMVSCKKGLETYDGQASIYFANAVESIDKKPVSDSTVISFAFAGETVKDSVLKLVVRATGATTSADRVYNLVIDPSSTLAKQQQYEILNQKFIIPANKVADTLRIRLKRTKEMQDKDFKLVLNLIENDQFKTLMQSTVLNSSTGKKLSYIKQIVWVNDILKQPKLWFDFYFGTFSRKKIFLMAEVMNFNISELDTYDTPIAKVLYYGGFMQRYLNEMKADGKTIYDEDGSEMTMGPGVQ
ncbi:DUF4843 domain-containing protein [Pedobacter sp.]|jgi:hypothetical protein|uniref:DUF4843 domain-containing protein n=1 Tax=Pedobacter sp. TaxID=1411316 RepID=UPI002D0CABA5|nr:DUF4843 domain-containing protein [Pedobacter sp.]HWW41014.1 DUF4843 domain-containing protein [Pedobacter sp.]